jgi:hypothetical protein
MIDIRMLPSSDDHKCSSVSLPVRRRPLLHVGHRLAQLRHGSRTVLAAREFLRRKRLERSADIEDVLDLLGVEVTYR